MAQGSMLGLGGSKPQVSQELHPKTFLSLSLM